MYRLLEATQRIAFQLGSLELSGSVAAAAIASEDDLFETPLSLLLESEPELEPGELASEPLWGFLCFVGLDAFWIGQEPSIGLQRASGSSFSGLELAEWGLVGPSEPSTVSS